MKKTRREKNIFKQTLCNSLCVCVCACVRESFNIKTVIVGLQSLTNIVHFSIAFIDIIINQHQSSHSTHKMSDAVYNEDYRIPDRLVGLGKQTHLFKRYSIYSELALVSSEHELNVNLFLFFFL